MELKESDPLEVYRVEKKTLEKLSQVNKCYFANADIMYDLTLHGPYNRKEPRFSDVFFVIIDNNTKSDTRNLLYYRNLDSPDAFIDEMGSADTGWLIVMALMRAVGTLVSNDEFLKSKVGIEFAAIREKRETSGNEDADDNPS